ncbi:MAG: TusE/DsrC/DsvC family sulfur relay protein [Gammaproteobacteria bacterium]|nr:TusE/DsrC/DsvC family sulfur relay protein [Gammaproteobacteria bacterium]
MLATTLHSTAIPPLDEHGLLQDPQHWNQTVAVVLAERLGVGPLTNEHWQIIHALRAHYTRFGAAPAMIQVCRLHGKERHWVHNLFSSCLNAWRVAGLPNPGEEAVTYLSGT